MRRFVPHLIFLSVTLVGFAWAVPVAMALPLADGATDYNAPGFLVRHSWVKFARVATRPFRDELSEPEKDARVARFFELNGLIAEQERIAGDPASDAAAAERARADDAVLRRERAGIENSVEEILDGRLTAVLTEQGLTRHIGRDIVWPPVSIEFEDPPAVLVESPRTEIRREHERLVLGSLPVAEKVRLESEAESDGETSALVVEIGAIAMYPAIIPPDADYRSVLRTIAHEWVHHYLYFSPLGRNFYDGDKLVTLNETVANIVGDEVGELMYARYPLERGPGFVTRGADDALVTAAPGTADVGALRASGDITTRFLAALGMTGRDTHGMEGRRYETRQEAFDFVKEMHSLRLEVDALLAAGRVEEAERVMEERRQTFVANGYYIRRINQAYFAFHGSYADTAASSDPIGPKMQRLREGSASVKEFLERAREITSEEDLDSAAE
ncbi:MAG: hypothetical protein HY873_06985 [Chloroflexi bacterium]|nr:hypothetical protein [Chloroflexota bacterium]